MLTGLGGIAHLGSLVRTAAAVLFPSLAVLDDRQPELGILLYLLETVLWSAVLFARSVVNLALLQRAEDVSERGREISQLRVARELTWVTLLIGTVALPLLGMAVFAIRGGAWDPQWALLRERGSYLAATILASAILDTLVAPVRSPLWLQSAVAHQVTRFFVLHPVVMFGFVFDSFTGSTRGMVTVFVAVRLIVDVNGWRPSIRELRRRRWFAALTEPEPRRPRGGRRSRGRVSG